MAKLISKWTGRIWQIHASLSNVGKSLYEEDIINQQKEIEIMKNHPEIKKIIENSEKLNLPNDLKITITNDQHTNHPPNSPTTPDTKPKKTNTKYPTIPHDYIGTQIKQTRTEYN